MTDSVEPWVGPRWSTACIPSAISSTASAYESERLDLRCCVATASEHAQDRIEHGIQFLAYVFGEEAENEVAILLKQSIFPSVTAVGHGIGEMLSAIDPHLALAVVKTMQAACVLGDGPPPRDGQREKQRVESWIVEALAHVLARGQNDA